MPQPFRCLAAGRASQGVMAASMAESGAAFKIPGAARNLCPSAARFIMPARARAVQRRRGGAAVRLTAPTVVLAAALPLWAGAAAAGADTVYQRLKAQVDRIRLVDTHEHLPNEADRLKQPADCLALMLHYVESDLVSAGLPREFQSGAWQVTLQDAAQPFEPRWTQFEKYWPDVRLTGYGRALRRAAADLYGVRLDAPTLDTARQLNRRLADARQPGLYRHILKDKARIDLSLNDVGSTRVDPEFFAAVLRFDHFVQIRSAGDLARLSRRTGVKIAALEDLVAALRKEFEQGRAQGMVGLKSALAYARPIYYPLPAVAEARQAFERIRAQPAPPPEEAARPLQNYMMHEVCRLAAQYRLPFQIHTGLQTGFGRREITDSRPTHLVSLIRAYPDVPFVLFHGGYPYGHELGTIAKNFPNAYIDMCWLHIIAPEAARASLAEWLDAVPANKIMAFGGDYTYAEGAYAHAELARENVARVLAGKVAAGDLSEDEALELARKILRTNAIQLFHLPLP